MCIVTSSVTVAGITMTAAMANTLITGAALAAVAGTAAVAGSYAQKQSASYNKRIAEVNAKAAQDYAKSIEAQGEWKHRKLATESLLEFGKARTGYAAAGVALGAGTPNDYEADIADAYELDSRQLDFDIQSQKYQALMQGADYYNQSKLHGMEASQAKSLMPLNTLSSSVQGFAQGAGLYKAFA